MLGALGIAAKAVEERSVQSLADIIGERDGFGVAENLDGFAAGVDDQAAVSATGEVLLEIHSHGGVEDTVEIARQFEDYFLAVHCVSLRRKYLLSFWRSLSRSRKRRDFTAAKEIPRIFAVSSVESPSTSRKRKATRKIGSSSPITLLRISLSSIWANFFSGEGPQSSISRKTESSPSVPGSGSSRDTWFGRRLRNFIRASLTAMRTSQV